MELHVGPTRSFEIEGVTVGHVTDPEARTGVTVIRFPETAVASGEVRGGAPATREFALLHPDRMVDRLDAVALCGGSAFGLAAADGVAQWAAEAGIGFPTAGGPVPIVVAMSLFDLNQGDGSVRPGPSQGRAAAEAATEQFATGSVGGGTGATIGKWGLAEGGEPSPGGIGFALVRKGSLRVGALMAVNAAGHIDDGSIPEAISEERFSWPSQGASFENTTIGVVVSNAALTKGQCQLVAQGGHDGLARAIFPPHSRTDGDAIVAVSVPPAEPDPDLDVDIDIVRLMAVIATEAAVRSVGQHPGE